VVLKLLTVENSLLRNVTQGLTVKRDKFSGIFFTVDDTKFPAHDEYRRGNGPLKFLQKLEMSLRYKTGGGLIT
jgi:hypothetical protein